jgi:branched-chain amino acid transport system permease protein
MSFFFEVLIGGLLSGVMYSLVALGFVLIYKASGVFNFAQGAMVFFAALTYVGLLELGLPPWAAVPATLVVMIALGLVTERVVLRPLVNQPQITLFMATIGLTFLIEGLAQLMWGANVRGLELGLQDEPIQWVTDKTGMSLSKFDLVAAAVAAILVTLLALFFSRTRIGRALRAVADDHQAALAVGIPLQHIWAIVWGVAGAVALVAGLLWGARNGVQFALTFVALKALPVLILVDSIRSRAIVWTHHRRIEKLAGSIGPFAGGGSGWFPYALALVFLLVRQGLFGDHSAHLATPRRSQRCSTAKPASSRRPTRRTPRSSRSGRIRSRSPSSWASPSSWCRSSQRRTSSRES